MATNPGMKNLTGPRIPQGFEIYFTERMLTLKNRNRT